MRTKKAAAPAKGPSLDALLAARPSRAAWRALAAALDRLPPARLGPALKKAAAAVARWPLGVRAMPAGWWASLLRGQAEPRAALARRRTLRAAREDDAAIHLRTYALAVDMSPDLGTFATADAAAFEPGGGDVVLWDALAGGPRRVLLAGAESRAEAHALRYSPDGRWVAAASIEGRSRGRIGLWSAQTGSLSWAQELDPRPAEREERYDDAPVVDEGGPNEMVALAFSPASDQLWSASRRRGRIRCWDVLTGGSRGELPDEPGVLGIAVSPNGKLFATVNEGGWLRVWDLTDESLLAEVRASDRALWAVSFSSDSKKVAVAGRRLSLYEIDLEHLVEIESHPLGARGDSIAGAFSLAARPKGVIRSATVVHGGVSVRDLPGKKAVRIKSRSGIESVRLSRDGSMLVAAGAGQVRLFWLRG
ncbi:MAG: hypothetical protein U0359_16570 [Byssovorax sp.]